MRARTTSIQALALLLFLLALGFAPAQAKEEGGGGLGPAPDVAVASPVGTWELTHGGEEFVRLRIDFEGPGRHSGRVLKYLKGEWTEFDVTGVEVRGAAVVIRTLKSKFNSKAELTLTLSPDGRRMSGTIFGDNYTQPFAIEARRVE